MKEGEREARLRLWFDMWLQGKNLGILELFSPNARYIESWGPAYNGADKIEHWFEEWNRRGRVTDWEIRQFFHKEDQTIVEWKFRSEMRDGSITAFEGLSLVRWTEGEKICFLQEFGCNIDRYDPYENGPAPEFRDESALWF